jgi:hypothetical protein
VNLEPYRDSELPERFLRWLERLRAVLRPVPAFTFGSGSPETVVVGVEGDRYYNRTGGVGTRLYVKTTDTGSTGWVAYG